MSPGLPILYLCSVAGLCIVLGSLLLLWKGRIYVDQATKQITEIVLPFGIKVKTNLPVILLFLSGGGLLVYAVAEVKEFGEEVTVDGQINGSASSIQLYASVASQSLPRSGEFTFALPVTHPSRKYTLLYAVDGNLLAHQIVDPSVDSGHVLHAIELQVPRAPRLVGKIDPIPSGY